MCGTDRKIVSMMAISDPSFFGAKQANSRVHSSDKKLNVTIRPQTIPTSDLYILFGMLLGRGQCLCLATVVLCMCTRIHKHTLTVTLLTCFLSTYKYVYVNLNV